MQINFARREVSCKVVYYGPCMSGKTTNLQVIHDKAPKDCAGDMVSVATEEERTLYFDFLPLDLGKVQGMSTKFQLYTVPGQIYYDAVRKLVLQGVDGVVFVADSQKSKMPENIESLNNLIDNLKEKGLDLKTLPHVMQWNKRDLGDINTVEEMDAKLNPHKTPSFEAVAVKGDGVFQTLKAVAKQVISKLNEEQTSGVASGSILAKPAEKPAEASRPAEIQSPEPPKPAPKPVEPLVPVGVVKEEKPAAAVAPPKEPFRPAPPPPPPAPKPPEPPAPHVKHEEQSPADIHAQILKRRKEAEKKEPEKAPATPVAASPSHAAPASKPAAEPQGTNKTFIIVGVVAAVVIVALIVYFLALR